MVDYLSLFFPGAGTILQNTGLVDQNEELLQSIIDAPGDFLAGGQDFLQGFLDAPGDLITDAGESLGKAVDDTIPDDISVDLGIGDISIAPDLGSMPFIDFGSLEKMFQFGADDQPLVDIDLGIDTEGLGRGLGAGLSGAVGGLIAGLVPIALIGAGALLGLKVVEKVID